MSKNPPGRSDAFRATGRGGAAPRAAVGRLLERQGGPDGVLGGGQPAEKIWENYGKNMGTFFGISSQKMG